MATTNDLQTLKQFVCKCCDYTSSDQSNYNRHINTLKHKMMTNGDGRTKNSPNTTNFKCECGKIYKYRQGFHRHAKTCIEKTKVTNSTENNENNENNNNNNNNNNNENTNSTENTNNIIFHLLAQNKELMNLITNKNEETKVLHETIKDIIPKIGTTNNTNNTTNNNKFNLNIFLSEDCKDAINFSDFIKNIQVSPEDLENQAQLGYVNGITKVFIDNIKRLEVNKRPIHCTDKKRNTLYIKENDEWNKEGSQECVIKGIQEITRRTHGTLIQLKADNSVEYADGDSDFSNKCIDIQRNLTPVFPREISFGKIVGNISDNTTIEENQRKLV